MTQRKRAGRRRERGIALVAVLLVLVLMLGIGAAFHTTVINDVVSRGANLRAAQGFYASEAGINLGMGTYRNIFLNYAIPTGNDFNPYTFNFNSRTVTYQLSNVAGNPFTVIVPAGRNFAGLNATEYRYTADSNSQLNLGDVEADVGTQFNVDYIPIFQFLAFFQRDLEIEPGPNATFHGPIHTNGNLYLNSNNTLTICDCTAGVGPGQCTPNAIPVVHVSAAGQIYRGRKDVNSCTGTVQVSKLVDADHNGLLDLQTMTCGGSTTQESSATLSTWLGSLLARQPVVAVPQPSALNRLTGQYWLSADLRIVLDLTTPDATGLFPIVVQNADGMAGDHILRTGDRIGRDRNAARQCLELHDAERVGAARKHKDVGGGEMGRKNTVVEHAEEFRLGKFALELGFLRTGADDDLGARQIE